MAKPRTDRRSPRQPRSETRSPEDTAFGRFVRLLRKGRGYTQEVLAERARLAADTIRRLERAEFSPSLDTLRKVADGLGIDLATLFSAFALGEPGTDRELLAMARSLSPHEIRVSIRVLVLLADLLTAVHGADGGDDGEE